MTIKQVQIIIKDDNGNELGHWDREDLTAEKWKKTEKANVIAFLDRYLGVKEKEIGLEKELQKLSKKDLQDLSDLLKACIHEATSIIDNTELRWSSKSPNERAERVEAISMQLFCKLMER